MDAVNKLLDKARATCSLPSDVALAEKLGVSRQLVSQWRKGANPLSDERIAQVAHLAKEDGGRWLLMIHAERASGAAAKDWQSLLRRFGAAAALATVALLPFQAGAKPLISDGQFVTNAYYVNSILGMAGPPLEPSTLYGTPPAYRTFIPVSGTGGARMNLDFEDE